MRAWLNVLFHILVGAFLGAVGTFAALLALFFVLASLVGDRSDELSDAGCLGREMTEAEVLSTARHEAGHTMVALALEPRWYERTNVYPTGTLTDDGSCASGVTTVNFPAQLTRTQMVEIIAIEYGGYAADLELNGELDTGASQDITVATARAIMMIDTYGMGRAVPPYDIQMLAQSGFALGPDVDRARSDEVQEILDRGLTLAQLIVGQNRDRVEAVAHALADSPFYSVNAIDIDAAISAVDEQVEEDVSLPTD